MSDRYHRAHEMWIRIVMDYSESCYEKQALEYILRMLSDEFDRGYSAGVYDKKEYKDDRD